MDVVPPRTSYPWAVTEARRPRRPSYQEPSALEALGERHDRGRSHLPPAAMAAESWVRAETGDVDPTSLRAEIVSEDADAATVRVSRRDGVEWTLHARLSVGEPLPESCGKAAVPSRTWAVTSVGVSPRPRP